MKNEQKKKSYSVKTYIKTHMFLILILLCIPIITIIVYCCISKDINGMASLFSSILTYLGTCILSIFIYYSSWKQNIIDFNNNIPDIEIRSIGKYLKDKEVFSLFDYNDIKTNLCTQFNACNNTIEDYLFYSISIRNVSLRKIKNVSPCYFLTIEKGKYCKNYTFLAGLPNTDFPIDYKNETTLYFGVNKKEVSELGVNKKHVVLRFVYYVQYDDNNIDIMITDAILGQTLGTGTKFINDLNILDKDAEFPYKVSNYYKQFLN